MSYIPFRDDISKHETHSHIDNVISQMEKIHITCATDTIRICDIFQDNIDTIRNLIKSLPDDANINKHIMELKIRNFTYKKNQKIKVNSVKAMHGSVEVNVEENNIWIDKDDLFKIHCSETQQVLAKRMCRIRKSSSSFSECIICREHSDSRTHCCDFLGYGTAECDDGSVRMVAFAVLNRFLCVDENSRQRPAIELILATPINILRAVCIIVDFTCELIPSIKTTNTNSVFDSENVFSSIPISVDSIIITVDFYINIIANLYKWEYKTIKNIKCLLLNLSLSTLLYDRHEKNTLVPFSSIPSDISLDNLNFDYEKKQFNILVITFLQELRCSILCFLFISDVGICNDVETLNNAVFMAHIIRICDNSKVLTIARNTLSKPENMTKIIQSRVTDTPLDGGNLKEIISLFTQIRAVFDDAYSIYVSDILQIQKHEIVTPAQALHLNISFLLFVFKNSFRGDFLLDTQNKKFSAIAMTE